MPVTLQVRLLAIALGGLIGLGAWITPSLTANAQTSPLAGIPLTGTAAGGGTVTGRLAITQFVVNPAGTGVDAVGTLTGTLRQPGGVTEQVGQTAQLPVSAAGTCERLHLELGPADPKLVGRTVRLDRGGLDITAQPEPGNLLGHLLCRVPRLLDDPVGLADVLNQIRAILNER
jgi:hypothetical protein